MSKNKNPQDNEPKFIQVIKSIIQEPLFYVGVFIVLLLLCLPAMFSNKEQVPETESVNEEQYREENQTKQKQAEEQKQVERKEQTAKKEEKQEEKSKLSKEEKDKYLKSIRLYPPDAAVFVTPNKPVRFYVKGKLKEFHTGTTWVIRANGKPIVAHTEQFGEEEIPSEIFQIVQKYAENNM